MKKTSLAIIMLLATAMSCPMLKGQSRDTRQMHDQHTFGLSGGWSCHQAGERGFAAGLSYDQSLNGIWWLGLEVNITATRTTTDTTPFLPQELVGVNVKFGPRFEFGPIYVYPAILAGVGTVAQNSLSGNGKVSQSWPFLAPQAGGRLAVGAQLGAVCFGVYATYLWQFAELQPHKADLQAEWLTRNPFQAGAELSLAIDNGVRHHGGNDVALAECFGSYGTHGVEAGAKVLFNRNTGLPWLQGKEAALRGEYVASQQYGVRFSETIGKENRTTVQLGYALSLHPNGPESAILYRLSLWAGMGEARHAANYTANQGDYNGAYTLLKNGLQGNAEIDVSFRIPSVRRAYLSLLGGISYTHVFGMQGFGTFEVTKSLFENPLGFYGGASLGWSF